MITYKCSNCSAIQEKKGLKYKAYYQRKQVCDKCFDILKRKKKYPYGFEKEKNKKKREEGIDQKLKEVTENKKLSDYQKIRRIHNILVINDYKFRTANTSLKTDIIARKTGLKRVFISRFI